jgi:DNA polymerase III delta prime subunit
MEKYSQHTRFVMTCNSVERIIEPIRSRAMEFKILPPSKDKVYERCAFILKNEGVEYDELEMKQTVDFAYPDVRKCIQSLEQQTINGVLKLNKEFFKLLRYQEKVVAICKGVKESNLEESVTTIRQMLADARIKNYAQLYRYLYDKLDEYCPGNKILKVIFQLEEGLKYDTMIADKEINVVSTILRIFEELIKK